MECLSFSVWVTPLSNIFFSSIHLPEKFKISFSFMDEKFPIMYISHFYWPFCQLKDIQIGFFFLYLSKVAMNIAKPVSVHQDMESFVHRPRNYVAGTYGGFTVRFLRISHSFLHSTFTSCSFRLTVNQGSLSSIPPPTVPIGELSNLF